MLNETRTYDFIVVGGGMAGCAAAVAAARRGLRTALLQDRPVLGGNASKEVRVWLHGADGGQNNRYYRESGWIEEVRLENLWRNPLGNAELWDLVLLESVLAEEGLDLYLNTVVLGAVKQPRGVLESVDAFTLGSERRWTFSAPLFADCTGDGTVAALAGAEFRTGREARTELGERLAPEKADPATQGSTLLFALKNAGRPVPFVPPTWAHSLTEEQLRFRPHRVEGTGAEYWWLEYGGELDTVHHNERIRQELLRIVWGMFAHLKHAPEHAGRMVDCTLEWVGSVPGKRSSRRIVGDYLLREADLVEQREHEDAVAVGGWGIEDHPSAGFFAQEPPRYQFYLPGIYNIPLRCLYSRDVPNVLLAGRDVSASHVAMCSARVMVTGAQMGEAVGAAAAHCLQRECLPRDLLENGGIYALQQDLLRSDHFIAGIRSEDQRELARSAEITESSVVEAALEKPTGSVPLDHARALMLPLAGKLEHISLHLEAEETARLRYAVHGPDPRGNYLPGPVELEGEVEVAGGAGDWVDFPCPLDDAEPGFHWLVVQPAPGVSLSTTEEKLVGVASYVHAPDHDPDPGPWTPDRPCLNPYSPWRKAKQSYCFRTDSWLPAFYGGEQVANGYSRPYRNPNIWISAPTGFDEAQWLEFTWEEPREIGTVCLYFNTDLDLDLRNLWTEHDFRAIPECVRHYRILALVEGVWETVAEERDNHQRHRSHRFPPVRTERLRLEILATHGDPRAQVYEVRIYGGE